MSKFIDLTGQKFSKLTVIERVENHKNGKIQYLVECNCKYHTRFIVIGENLKSGTTTKCKKCRVWNYNDLTGMEFGLWRVLERVKNKNKQIYYLCECQCENKTLREVLGNSLMRGRSKSCGCENYKNITGKKFDKLLITNEYCIDNVWFCDADCDCGNKSIKIFKASIVRGDTRSCGCIQKETRLIANLKHGLKNSHIYRTYYGMLDRCSNIKNDSYNHYGGRGIIICDEWLNKNGLVNFYNWSMENGYQEDLSIDRINVNGNYEPNNCRWITKDEQNRNKTNSLKIIYKGKERLFAELLHELNLQNNRDAIYSRIKKGWDIEKALFTPIGVISNSKGEKRINNYLILCDILFQPRKTFKSLIGVGNGYLSYDFYLPTYNLLIEFQGKHHEKYISGFHKTYADFEKQLEHDRRKREYAQNNNINLLEIWYYNYENIENILEDEFMKLIGK